MTKPITLKPKAKRTRKVKGVEVKSHLDLGLPEALAVPLHRALSLKRSNGTAGEANFVAWLVGHLSAYTPLRMVDNGGNIHFRVDHPDGRFSDTLFVAHTDTMSYEAGTVNHYYKAGDTLLVKEDVLGADNGCGVSLMCYMIANKIPGRYIFTRAEECGGIGARALADDYSYILKTFNRAITFDRRGTADVISHQGGSRCCSDDFAWELALELNKEDKFLYAPSDRGVYTDTKEFVGLIAECTNISTGYDSEHGPSETLNLAHYKLLAEAALKVDWDNLPTVRNPSQPVKYSWTTHASTQQLSWEDEIEEAEFDDALTDFESGNERPLRKLLALELYPEDPAMAERFIDVKRLTQLNISTARHMEVKQGREMLLGIAMLQEAKT